MRDGFAIPKGDRPPVAALAHDPAGVVRVAAAAAERSRGTAAAARQTRTEARHSMGGRAWPRGKR